MSKLVVVENVSLDGVMQAPGRPDEDIGGGFDRGGWATQALEKDPEAAQASMAGQAETGALLFGRRTYEDVVGHWLSTSEPNPFTEILEKTPKYVASRTLTEPLPHPNSTLLKGDAINEISALKQESDKDIAVLGSGVLVRDLAATGLIDEYILTIIPVVLGSGTRLFGDTYIPLQVANSVTTSSGIVVATLRVDSS
jgi:dihydrofolate reductase